MTYDHLSSYLDEPFNIVICFLSNYTSCVNCRKRTKKTRDMWWQGLPTNVRGKVWKLAIGNDLNLTPGLYPHFYTHTFTTTCTCMPRLTYLCFLPSFYKTLFFPVLQCSFQASPDNYIIIVICHIPQPIHTPKNVSKTRKHTNTCSSLTLFYKIF